MITRRGFLKLGATVGAGLISPWRKGLLRAPAAQSPQVPLAPAAIPQFVDPLPDLDILPVGAGPVELFMKEFQVPVLPANTVPGYAGTWVWGYLQPGQTSRASYLGPVIVATRGNATEFRFFNDLGGANSTNVLAYKYSTDQTLHWADPLNGEMNMWNHMSMPPAPGTEGAENYLGPVPAVVHLHGGEVPPVLDGGPDAWVTSDGAYKGHGFYSKDGAAATNYHIYRYPNSQEGAPIWFHDHTLGATRLNVYAGLAGGYLIVDPPNDPANLPWPPTPLVIQDRRFDTNGQLFFTADSAGGILWALNPEHPYWNPEFVGDVICVNGKSWPFKSVFQQRYTFLFLNGSNARAYEMFLVNPVTGAAGPNFWVIGTDGGYLDKPVMVKKLVMLPGERYLAIIDFAGFPGTWLLKNTAKTPFPAGGTPKGSTTGRIMQFVVTGGAVADTTFNPAAVGATLRAGPVGGTNPKIVRLANPATGTLAAGVTPQKTRQLTLNEVMGMPQLATDPVTGLVTAFPGGPLEILVNNTKWDGKRIVGVDPGMGMYMFDPVPGFTPDGFGNYLSELPNEGDTEIWEIVNLTADAHPIHLHLVQFQIMNRQKFDTGGYNAAYAAAFPGGGWDTMAGAAYPAGVYIPGFGPPLDYNAGNARALGGNPDIVPFLKGRISLPLPQEAGWKDTVIAYPGEVTRIVVRWAPTDVAVGDTAKEHYPFDPAAGGHGYVWHCHIIDHEDNEMMRPDVVTPKGVGRTYVMGTDY